MDDHRFDALTRSLARTDVSRRKVLRGLLGGGALTLLGAHGVAAKSATKTPTKTKKTSGTSGCTLNSDCPEGGNPCTASVCDGGTGQCEQVAVVRGKECGDGKICDGNGVCYTPYDYGII